MTQLFFTHVVTDYSSGTPDVNLAGSPSSWNREILSNSRGSGVTSLTTNTVTGPTNGIEVRAGAGAPFVWYSPPLDADVTISGSITWNLRASENSMSANVAINGRLEVVDGATGAVTLIDQTARVTELTLTTETAENFAETPAAGILCKRGDRLRVRVFGDDAGTMATGFSFTFWYAGTSAAASGDSYLTTTETLTFVSEPAGSQVFPTDVASDVVTASVDREAWTSRGAGVQTDATTTTATDTPVQVTDTAGGTVVDWFTKQLSAFTLGGAARCNIRGKYDLSSGSTFRIEVSVVASDGTGAVAWGVTTVNVLLTGSETATSFLVSGANVAVTDGQRLRIRAFIDSEGDTAGRTITLYYAGTSGGASGDSYVTFTQTLTVFTPSVFTPYRNPMPTLIAH